MRLSNNVLCLDRLRPKLWRPQSAKDVTLHSLCACQVARAGRFGTKGLAITFVSDETDAKTLNDVQDRFEVNVAELPDEIDISSYSEFFPFPNVNTQLM